MVCPMSTTNPTAADVADRAADNMAERGHLKSNWGYPGEAQCINGHLDTALNELGLDNTRHGAFEAVTATVCDLVGLDPSKQGPTFAAMYWNNDPNTPTDAVISALRDAATKLRPDTYNTKETP